jgi:SAM-dependent methyltransferase
MDFYFHSRYSQTPGRDRAWRAICGHLQRYVPTSAAVLDLGAGYCSFINNIRAAEKHALDIFPGFPQYAHADVTTHVGDSRDLGAFGAGQFHVVFASNLLEHLTREDTLEVLREARRVLTPGGRLILIQPNFRHAFKEYFDDYTHLQIFTHIGLSDLLRSSGYVVEKTDPRFLPFSFHSRLPTWHWLVKLYLSLPFRPLAKQMLIVASPTPPEVNPSGEKP